MTETLDIADLVAKAILPDSPAAGDIIHADELDALPPVSWLIPDLLPANSLAVLYGPSGSGKSFLSLHLAFHIAQAAPVLYIAAEGLASYAARKLAWCNLNHLSAARCYFHTRAPNLLDAEQVNRLMVAARPFRPVLVIVDTLARCMLDGDENSSRDMGKLIAACDQLKDALQATILLVHHTGKSGLSERGSSALRAAADQMLELSADDGLLALSCAKSKDALQFAPRAYRLVTVETGRLASNGQPETSCAIVPAEKVFTEGQVTPTGRLILETLAMETFAESGARATTLINITNLRASSLYRLLSALIRYGYVRQTKRGDPYFITDQGQEALSTLLRVS